MNECEKSRIIERSNLAKLEEKMAIEKKKKIYSIDEFMESFCLKNRNYREII